MNITSSTWAKKMGILLLGFSLPLLLAMYYYQWDSTSYQLFSTCPSKQFLHLDCALCGTQRMFNAILKGDFTTAFLQNPLVFILLPLLVYKYVQFLYRWFKKGKFPSLEINSKVLIIILIVFTLYTLFRNLI